MTYPVTAETFRIPANASAGPVDTAVLTGRKLTRHQFEASWFARYWESCDLQDAALEAALPPPARIDGITRHEFVWLVRQIQRGDHVNSFYLRLFEGRTFSIRSPAT